MTSFFTNFVARGIEVPEIDPRLLSHIDIREVIPAEERPAAPTDVSITVTAPVEARTTIVDPLAEDGTSIPK